MHSEHDFIGIEMLWIGKYGLYFHSVTDASGHICNRCSHFFELSQGHAQLILRRDSPASDKQDSGYQSVIILNHLNEYDLYYIYQPA